MEGGGGTTGGFGPILALESRPGGAPIGTVLEEDEANDDDAEDDAIASAGLFAVLHGYAVLAAGRGGGGGGSGGALGAFGRGGQFSIWNLSSEDSVSDSGDGTLELGPASSF